MEKILKILHKKLDKKDKSEFYKKQSKVMEELFAFDKLPYVNKNEFDYFKNEINYHGIINKQAIEKAYKEARINMDDYYDTLSYVQKNKLMDYEIKKCLEDKKSFCYENQNIYIPFFNTELNRIYENEMTLFDLKKYADIMLFYDKLMEKNIYGYKIYNSEFSSLEYIYEEDINCALYCDNKERLYFLKNYEMVDFITISKLEKEKLMKIARDYFLNDENSLIDDLFEFHCIDEKLNKKLNKKRK